MQCCHKSAKNSVYTDHVTNEEIIRVLDQQEYLVESELLWLVTHHDTQVWKDVT